jgi:hypothetical protein
LKIPFTVLWVSVTLAGGETLLDERFESDPSASRALISGDSSRFSFNASARTLTASYDLLKPHARIAWPLSQTLRETDSFTATVEFTLSSINFDDFNFCQLSFGLINAVNTGSQRTVAPGNSWECLTVDYFPGASYPTYTPTFISQNDGSGNALTSNSLKFPDGATSLINDFGEIGPLPANTRLTTALSYEASTRTITLRLSDENGGLPINKFGINPDNDPSTIQLILTEEFPFRFDAFALLLWQHNQSGSADLNVHSIHVKTSEINLVRTAFPDGIPAPVFENGVLSITYRHDTEITVFAESSSNLKTWKRVPHALILLGPGHEIRKVETTESFLRFNLNYP